MADATFDMYGYFKIFGYSVWIPRLNGGVYLPPLVPGDSAGYYRYPQPMSTEPFRGPMRLGDPLASVNPIVTDFAGSAPQDPPADADISRPGNPFGLRNLSNHQWRDGALESINAGYADGHVETIPGSLVRPRYKGNHWNWR